MKFSFGFGTPQQYCALANVVRENRDDFTRHSNESDGELIMSGIDKILSDKTKVVTVNHISNALGTVNPIKYMIDKA
jgi:selenocysteine lyase/cysteine desulfurase